MHGQGQCRNLHPSMNLGRAESRYCLTTTLPENSKKTVIRSAPWLNTRVCRSDMPISAVNSLHIMEKRLGSCTSTAADAAAPAAAAAAAVIAGLPAEQRSGGRRWGRRLY
eukprot:1159195-Pelagomonas_calceolata.AAC.7